VPRGARAHFGLRASQAIILREGTGWGAASEKRSPIFHERAIRLRKPTPPNAHLRPSENRLWALVSTTRGRAGCPGHPANSFSIFGPGGAVISDSLSPEAFCSGCVSYRQVRPHPSSPFGTPRTWARIGRLREEKPALKSQRGSICRHSGAVDHRTSECCSHRERGSRPIPICRKPRRRSIKDCARAKDRQGEPAAKYPAANSATGTFCARLRHALPWSAGQEPSHAHHLNFPKPWLGTEGQRRICRAPLRAGP